MSSSPLRRLALFASAGLAGGAIALLAPPALGRPQPESGWGLPRDFSVDGHRIDWLIEVTMVFTVILFVIMCVWMLWACLKHNEKHVAEYDHGNAKKQVQHAAIISSIIFFVVDGNLWINSTIDVNQAFWNFEKAEADPKKVRIEINAHQWAWDARYPGPDGKFNTKDDVVTLNDIRVPVNRAIIFQLASTDVIHSFYLPNFRIKQDAVPGMVNRMWFQAQEKAAGQQFEIGCAQHCGSAHYKMKGTLTVLSEAEFDRWYAEASANGARSFNADDQGAQGGWEWQGNP